MSDTESELSDLELELTEPDCTEDEEESDEAYSGSSEDEGSDDDPEPIKEVVKTAPKVLVAVEAKEEEDEEEENEPIEIQSSEEENEEDEEEEDRQPSVQEQTDRREKNIKAMLEGSLEIHRKPLLPKLLTVQDAAAVLRKPFKSPHPNAPARSEALRRALVARKQFVPWGASGKPFQAPVKFIPQTSDDPSADAAAPPVELPPGIEPLILWEPPPGAEGNHVRVDDALTRFLRPHQREGVQFMFECVCGLRSYEGNGCILADDMGLGKTLQGIALLWTLLNNGHEALGGVPLARRIIICCPTSLVSNWDSECTKWLNGRVRTLPLCESSREDVILTINQFLSPRNPAQLLIVSYETFRLHAERFQAPDSCDLLICDEAHRLKNDQTLTNRALGSLACRRRVLLSGTPMQNQLQEFYSMVNFANPGVLGTPSQFRRHYESPILAGREPDASDAEATLGAERSSQLSDIVNEFILRRTNSLLSAHLPPKVIEVVCCRMTPLQYDLYCHFVQSRSVQNLFATQKSARALTAINSLRKLLNHPKLIYDMVHSSVTKTSRATATDGGAEGFEDCGKLFPPGIFDSGSRSGRGGGMPGGGGSGSGSLPHGWEGLSGKFGVVARMLALLREQTKDRIVIVSNYTQTLDLFTNLCRDRGYPVLRLDGSTSISKRQKLVKRFNDPMDNQYVFLLSSKAGGCGLNLIGGNRLILFDMSWNPADDKQAAARVWRDGQRRRVYVYRFMTTGTIEEKVYQRQLSKEGLQAVVDTKSSGGAGGANAAVMSLEELRDLFSYDPDTLSTTYDHMVASKGLPKKKKPDKPLTKKATAAAKKAAKAAAKKKVEMEFEDSEEEEDVILVESDDEENQADDEVEEEEEENEELPVATAAPAGNGKALLSAALAATGGIFKEQDGNPKEEDLSAWGHHSDPKTVPDDVMQLAGGDDVTFVFSCQVDGRDVPPDAPLVPLGQGKAKTTGGLNGAMGHGATGAPGGGMRRHMAALARPATAMPLLGAARNNNKNGPSPAATGNIVAANPSPATTATVVVQKENQQQGKEASRPPMKEKISPPMAAMRSVTVPAKPSAGKGKEKVKEIEKNRSVSVPKIAGTKRPSPTSVAPSVPTAGTKKKISNAAAVPAEKRRPSHPSTAAAGGAAAKRMAILCDSSDDDFK